MSRKKVTLESPVLKSCLEVLSWYKEIQVERINTGGFYNPNGKYVKMNSAGTPDISGMFTAGVWKGCVLGIEVKKPDFKPELLRGFDRAHFMNQINRLKNINENGGVGFWVSHSEQLVQVMPRIITGLRVYFDENYYPWLTDEPVNSDIEF